MVQAVLQELDHAVRAARRRRRSRRAQPHAEARPDDPQGDGRPDGRARDDDAARVPSLPRPARLGERLPVGPVPRARVRARPQARRRASSTSRPDRRRASGSTRRLRAADAVGCRSAATSRASGFDVPARCADPRRRPQPTEPTTELQAILLEVYRTDAEHRDALRAARRPRRRAAGVALPPRQDGRAHDRHQAGHRRLARAAYLPPPFEPFFPDLWAIRSSCSRNNT